MTTSFDTDPQLWQDLIGGDESAFSALFERHYPVLVGYGKSLMPDAERVRDCVQDVFVDVWLYRQKLNPGAVPKTYLISCVRKRIARWYQRERIFQQTTPLDGNSATVEFSLDFTVEDRLISNEETALLVRRLNQMLNSLTARQREALYLRYHQGLSVEEIAYILEINKQSVSNLLHRSLRQLRRDWPGTTSVLLLLLLTAAF